MMPQDPQDQSSGLAVGAYTPQPPTSATTDQTQDTTQDTTQDVMNDMQRANTPTIYARKGGYVKSADGKAKRGKTRGRIV